MFERFYLSRSRDINKTFLMVRTLSTLPLADSLRYSGRRPAIMRTMNLPESTWY